MQATELTYFSLSQKTLFLGNLDSLRDWGHARDYVEASVCVCVCVCVRVGRMTMLPSVTTQGMWRILQQDKPSDYVLATGEMHTVKEFVEEAFKFVEVDIECATAIVPQAPHGYCV